MKPSTKFLFKTLLGVSCLFFYCEYLVFYLVQMNCTWPILDPSKEDKNNTSNEEPVKILVIADTHLLGSKKGHWFDKLKREWQMYRAFQTAMTLHSPEVVFVLGDLLDEGSFCSEEEFNYYIDRFYSMFKVPETTHMYIAVGNHDIGFHYRINPYLQKRFEAGFKAPSVQLISIRGSHFVLINSMALEGDGCFLCRPAELELNKIEKILKCSQNYSKDCNHQRRIGKYSRPILMQHYPLYRESDTECKDFDAAPLPEKESRFREKWDCLGKEATYAILKQMPKTPDEWRKIAQDFEKNWNFPHCLGAIDGKHIIIEAPMNSGTEFYNYKGTFSVVLMALVNANYEFMYVDIGCQGRISDGGVFRNTTLFQKLDKNELMLPPDEPLPSCKEPLPYVFVGDDAFALSTHLLKPYPGTYDKGTQRRIFNYRLSRARRLVENAFGILASVFRVFRKPMLLEPHRVTEITMTCVLLHNFLRNSRTSTTRYLSPDMLDNDIDGQIIPGSWRAENDKMNSFLPLRQVARRPGQDAKNVRDSYANYFSGQGVVSWQNNV